MSALASPNSCISLLKTRQGRAQRQALLPDPAVAIGAMELRASKMTLQMKLWHDADLFRLLQDLGDAGVHTLNTCTLIRTGSDRPPP